MLIRTQNKKAIVSLNNVTEISMFTYRKKNEIREKYPTDIRYYEGDKYDVLGGYSSEEKAMKVLDMIQDEYAEGCEWLTAAGKVFNMPLESEVNV